MRKTKNIFDNLNLYIHANVYASPPGHPSSGKTGSNSNLLLTILKAPDVDDSK